MTKRTWFLSVLKADYRVLALMLAVGILTTAMGLLMAVVIQLLIDDIIPANDTGYLMAAIAVAFLLLMGKVGLGTAQKYFGIRQARNFNMRLIDAFFGRLLRLPKSFFDSHNTGDLIARMNDSISIQQTIAYMVNSLAINLITAVGSGILLCYYSILSGVLAFTCFFIFFLISYSYRKDIAGKVLKMMEASAVKESNYITTLHNIELIKGQNKQEHFTQVNSSTYGDFQNANFYVGKAGVRIGFLLETTGTLCYMAILTAVSYAAFQGTLSIGSLSAVLTIAGGLLPVMAALGLSVVELQGAHIAFNRMYELAVLPPEPDSQKGNDPLPIDFIGELSLEHLHFSYVPEQKVLSDLSLTVKKGEMIGIFGENGSGKSTLLKLIMGFYQAQKGSVQINRNDFTSYRLGALRNKIAYVSQQTRLFNTSLIENICLSKDPSVIADTIAYLDQIGFGAFVSKIPGRYQAQIRENGNNLSGGQKQFIAFIRALCLQPDVLLLDEPTAAMDLETEHYVLELLKAYKPNGIVILVTHRLRPAKISDRIYVLENGSVAVSGNHETLISKGDNRYAYSYKSLVND